MSKSGRQMARRRRSSGCAPLILLAGALISGLCLLILLLLLALNRAAWPAAPTILVMGSDRRSAEQGPARSDLMILVGFNPAAQQAALLSIPRDLWVNVPGVGEQRINTALVFGYDATDPAAGPELAKATVAQQFRLPVDRYALLDFQTFVSLVDALGGVEIDAPQPITDSQYPTPDYGVTTIHFDAGRQVLDGERALIYVRTRHADSDFGRSERQQQVMRAVAARLARPQVWLRLPRLYAILRQGVQTDLQAADWPALLPLAIALGEGRTASATLEGVYSQPWVTAAGAWVLLPNWPAIDALVDDLFGVRPGQ